MTTMTDKKSAAAEKPAEIVEGTVVEETTTDAGKNKKEIVKIAAIVAGTVVFHVGCALLIRKLNKSASVPEITTN